MSRPVRIRDDLIQWLDQEASRLGIETPALVNDVLDRNRAAGLYAEGRPVSIPPGWSGRAREELDAAPVDARLLLTYDNGRDPWPWLVAGKKKEGTSSQVIEIEIYAGGRRMVVPRVHLITWHVVEAGDFQSEILRHGFHYQVYGIRLHPLVTLPHRQQHGL